MVEYFYYIKKTKPTLSAVESLEVLRVMKYFGKLPFVSISLLAGSIIKSVVTSIKRVLQRLCYCPTVSSPQSQQRIFNR
jgi:hypothetical protein